MRIKSYEHIELTESQLRELFTRISRGDEAAFTEVFWHFNKFMVPYVEKKLRSQEATVEIIQETFLRLWQYRSSLSELENPTGYVYRIAANVLNRHFTALGKSFVGMSEDLTEQEQTGVESNPDAQLEYKELRAWYIRSVEELPEQRRKIYLLKEQGMTTQEIADQLNLSSHTVKNQLAAAYKTLRSLMEQRGLPAVIFLFFFGENIF